MNPSEPREPGFGPTIRKLREEKKISLRKFAQSVELSPTFISKLERGEATPPSEAKVRQMAAVLGQNVDEFLALAGRVSTELQEIIRDNPGPLSVLLRRSKDLNQRQLNLLFDELDKLLDEPSGGDPDKTK